ncbi:MAG: PD-(D/E)XK nuclease family protein [Bdellovibrionales bacterium]|nr:PD-(D/E)XK nuclease family protein [Bdellovibrionales bacterium]
MPGFTLNSAVDHLFKVEFDRYRAQKKSHPIMIEYGIEAIPFQHPDLDVWRENFKGVSFHHEPTNFLFAGAVDDVWIQKNQELIIVDYKSTSKNGEVELTDAPWHHAYRRQMEMYQWLFRKNKFQVSDTGYFVYANGIKEREGFNNQLEFKTILIPYKGDSSWVEPTLIKAHECLASDKLPESKDECEYCKYRNETSVVERKSNDG